MFGIRPSPTVMREGLPSFPCVLEIAQPDYTRRDSSVNGVVRTVYRIDRAFINLPMAEARDFHCFSHVLDNLEKRSIPSDHAAVRLVFPQKTTIWGHQGKRIPSWMSKHLVFCSILKQINDDHLYLNTHFGALADLNLSSKKQEVRLSANSHVRHLTAWEPSF